MLFEKKRLSTRESCYWSKRATNCLNHSSGSACFLPKLKELIIQKLEHPFMVNASIVLYHNNLDQLKKAIHSALNSSLLNTLYLIDNSRTNELQVLAEIDHRIEYIFNNANLGYGKAHNIALKKKPFA